MPQTQVARYTMEAFVEYVNNVFKNEAAPCSGQDGFHLSKETGGSAGACYMPGDIHDTLNVQEGRTLVVRLGS